MRSRAAGWAQCAWPPRKGRQRLFAYSFLLIWVPKAALAADAEPVVRDNFGGAGMIDMPSARMAPDGEFSASASFLQNTQHYNFGFQVMPWLEASFRYSGLQHFDPAYSTYYDRSFALKARLWNEGEILPAVALGINDLVGTGVYSSEYLVASKRIGSFDASLGIGWGRLGSTAQFENPLISLSDSFRNRTLYPSNAPGGFDSNTLFHGPSSSVFGGLIWHTPFKGLSLIAEYSSDAYTLEAARGTFKPRSQMNYGASYEVVSGVAVGLDWLYGRSIGGNISIQLDPTRPAYPQKIDPLPPPAATRTPAEQQQALVNLLQRPAQNVGDIFAAQARLNAQKNDFVDSLWRQQNTSNVAVEGTNLILTVSDANLAAHCGTAAGLVRIADNDIRSITIRRNASASLFCDARLPAERNFEANRAGPQPPSHAALSQAMLTIDAAGPAPMDGAATVAAIRTDATHQMIRIEAITLSAAEATVYYSNTHYFAETDALDRLTRILMKDAPPGIEKFRLISVTNDLPQAEFDVLRAPQERAWIVSQNTALDLSTIAHDAAPAPADNPALAIQRNDSFPRFSWEIFPQMRQEVLDPSRPFAVQFLVGARGEVDVAPGLSLKSEVDTSLFDNFSANRPSNSSLPHVRSDFVNYYAQGKTGMGELEADYRVRLSPTVFAIAKAGYLESMFAGTGGEILWRPESQRWALGVDAYEVWQRNFDRLFGLQDYHAFTGHVSLYYASPWYDLNFALRAGQYLAGDRGVTFEMTRRFASGVEIGAFVTKTNVSEARFGEGGFDKGLIIRIPLGWVLPINTQTEFHVMLRPVQRDGGQRLENDASLFDETRRDSQAEIENEFRYLPP